MHERFGYGQLRDIETKAAELNVHIPISHDTGILNEEINIDPLVLRNRLVIQPMEGCDADENGKPSELTSRRYKRFAESGAALIWFEAVSVVPEGRANPRQLLINEENTEDLARLAADIKETAYRRHGLYPAVIMQATHSGRYSKPNGYPEPIIAYNSPVFEKDNPIDASRIISDDGLKRLEDEFFHAFTLCKRAGFDGVDVKCCHRYLNSELLSAHTRSGDYGGSFENRTRFFLNLIERAESLGEDFITTSRMNVYDGFPYPYGFGVNERDGLKPDLTEGKKLVKILHQKYGIRLLNVTIGNPYVNPHVNRPYDSGGYVPDEHPLVGLSRMAYCCGEIQKEFPELAVITSGNSYLRAFAPNMAAGAIAEGLGTLAGFGRMAFAYPDFATDILEKGELIPGKCCVTCGKCAELLRGGKPAGCVLRDPCYTDIYMEMKSNGQ